VERLVLVNAGGVALGPARLAVIVNGFRVFNAVLGRPGVMRALARRPRLRRLVFAGFVTDPATLGGAFAAEVVPTMAAPGFGGAVVAAGRIAGAIDTDQVRCPVLLVWGTADRILPLAGARALQESLLDARLVELRGAGHCPMFEQPAAVNRAVLAFVDGR
jgi:pimeloyl-ACP methyl ester carboxylesterase